MEMLVSEWIPIFTWTFYMSVDHMPAPGGHSAKEPVDEAGLLGSPAPFGGIFAA